MKPFAQYLLITQLFLTPLFARQPFYDRTHFSQTFNQQRNYRVFLPGEYPQSGRHYPVIYYFHGHSDRYTLEHYDGGTDTVPRIARFAAENDLIVVAVDGYVAEHYSGFYGGDPWDVREDAGSYDFGQYFLELIEHIDGEYQTLRDRRHRAASGLSMGGFMSLYLSARYPHLIGSASAFNPGPEFYVGNRGRRVLWRPKDHVSNHSHTRVRLVRASGDYISQYHEETKMAYARASEVQFEFRQDEYHKHAATSIEETFDFHKRAFADSTLDNSPVLWHHASPFSEFEVWGFQVKAPGEEKAIVSLEDVSQGGLRIRTRRWAPDGPSLPSRQITIRTAPLYRAKAPYLLLDHPLASGATQRRTVVADSEGRLGFAVDGSGREISFVGPGTGAQPPVLLPLTEKDRLYLPPQRPTALPIRIYNPRGEPMTDIRLKLTSEYPTVEIIKGTHQIESLASGAEFDLSEFMQARFTAGAGYFEPLALNLQITYDGWHSVSRKIEVAVIPEVLNPPAAVEVLDGRTITFNVFRQAGNQGGGQSISREVREGRGNGNGILEPGEEATIWVKMVQGLDPFDKNNWYRTKIRSSSPWIRERADIQEQKQREWTGAMERTSLISLSSEAPSGSRLPLVLENETWSFHYTPDVRYGKEKLYQAFQLHEKHLHRYELVVP